MNLRKNNFNSLRWKGLQRQRLIGSAVAGFNLAKTITKASATDLHARQDDITKDNDPLGA